MFDNLGDDFPFDWLVKCFQKKKNNIVDIFNRYSRNCLFPTLLYICVSGQFLPKMLWNKNRN